MINSPSELWVQILCYNRTFLKNCGCNCTNCTHANATPEWLGMYGFKVYDLKLHKCNYYVTSGLPYYSSSLYYSGGRLSPKREWTKERANGKHTMRETNFVRFSFFKRMCKARDINPFWKIILIFLDAWISCATSSLRTTFLSISCVPLFQLLPT